MGRTLPKHYIDFSANINPFGPPPELNDQWQNFFQEIMVYPDPHGLQLKERIARIERTTVDNLLIGNGGAELIALVARMMAGKKVCIVEPTFSEYETACRANHCEILYHQLVEPDFSLNPHSFCSMLDEVDALFLCNPNNPTGIYYQTSTILSIIEACEKCDCLVILDEAFFDFLIDYDSLIPYINKYENLLIIRSMTKMYAIPGIRLGYLIAWPTIISKLRGLQSQWNTNTIALMTGEICLQNESFVQKTQLFISSERKRLFDFFKQSAYVFTQSEVNFYLLRDPLLDKQLLLFEFLLDRGMIPRHTMNFPGIEGRWLRFAIKGAEDNNQLMEALSIWRKHHSSL